MLSFLFMLPLISCTSESKDTSETELLMEGNFQILTYNIHGLPSAVTEDDTPARIAQLSPMLNDFPLVALQEDWDSENHNVILENTDHPYDDFFDEKIEADKQYGSGLAFLSQLEFLSIEHTHYLECNGYLDGASDCFASKGFQFVEVPLNAEQSIHIYNTHLEAGGGDEDNAARETQVAQLLEAFEANSSDTPMIFLGDSNLHYDDPNDAPLLDLFFDAGLEETCLLVDCPEPNNIDKIFIRSSSSVTLTVDEWKREESFVDSEGVDLSDHPAISARISWQIQ